jgi:hypothetical protein
MYNGQEKRKYERKYKRIWKQYMARFKIRSDEAQETESDDWGSVTLRNLSAGGTYFNYKKDLGISSLLDLKINVPEYILIINCVGKVIRIDKPKSTSMYSIAIKLIDIGEQEREAINTAVEEALEQANKTSLA